MNETDVIDSNVVAVTIESVSQATESQDANLDAMICLRTIDTLADVDNSTKTEFMQLKRRQDNIRLLHQLMKAINKATDNKSTVDLTKNPELKACFEQINTSVAKFIADSEALLRKSEETQNKALTLENEGKKEEAEDLRERAASLKEDALELKEVAKILTIDKEKTFFSKDERERILENARTTCGDLNVRNDLQMQTIQRLTNNRHELLHYARTIQKTVQDTLMRISQRIGGR